jgi:hypothetical protein
VQRNDALGQENHVLEWKQRDRHRHVGRLLDG